MSALFFAPRQPFEPFGLRSCSKLLSEVQTLDVIHPHNPQYTPSFQRPLQQQKKQLPAGVFQAEEGEPKVLLGLKHTQSDFGGARVLRSIIPPVCAQRFSTSQVFGLLTDVCPDSPRAWSVCYPCTVKNLTASRKKCAVLTEADRRLMQSLWSDA